MSPRLVASYFGTDPKWAQMATVLRQSLAQHCPSWIAQIDSIVPASYTSVLHRQSYVDNTQKMEHWHQAVMASSEGDQLLLIDADTLITNPLEVIWDLPFDVTYTAKAHTRFPFNSGVVFLRVNDRSKTFIDTWWQENIRLLKDRKEHQFWRQQYGGINQAALGSALAKHAASNIHLVSIPCLEWNCEDTSWDQFDPAVTKILHLKGKLRRAIFNDTNPGLLSPKIRSLAALWHTRAAL